jgi:hypothetical protein
VDDGIHFRVGPVDPDAVEWFYWFGGPTRETIFHAVVTPGAIRDTRVGWFLRALLGTLGMEPCPGAASVMSPLSTGSDWGDLTPGDELGLCQVYGDPCGST